MSKKETSSHITSVGFYAGIYIVLMVLLAITVTMDFYLVGVAGLLTAMAIAVAKAALVVLYFMHIRYSTRLTWVFAAAAFMWLAIMAGLTLSDYLTRPLAPYRLMVNEAASVQDAYTRPPRLEGTGFNLHDEGIHWEMRQPPPPAPEQ